MITLVTNRKNLVLLFFGYPSQPPTAVGLVWTKRVADHIEKEETLMVKKISNDRAVLKKISNNISIRKAAFYLVDEMHDALNGFSKSPDIAILDSWGIANIILWILIRLFKPEAKILTVFHHYEPRVTRTKNPFVRAFEVTYNWLCEIGTKAMIRNSNRVLTVSLSSAKQLNSIYGLVNSKSNKVAVVGAAIDAFPICSKKEKKNIDFLCIGRIEKFTGLEKIWKLIREMYSNVKFVMIGRATPEDIQRLQILGIDHRGMVSIAEKIELYKRARVFVFPSAREGFGISVAEALYAGLSVVSWKLPVFEEIYDNNSRYLNIKLVEFGDCQKFAEEALRSLKKVDRKTTIQNEPAESHLEVNNTWEHVAKNVMAVIKEISNQ